MTRGERRVYITLASPCGRRRSGACGGRAVLPVALAALACAAAAVPSPARAWRDASSVADYVQDVPVRWQGDSVSLQVVDNGPIAYVDMQAALLQATGVWTSARCASVIFDVATTPGIAPASGDRRVTISWITRGWAGFGFSADAAASTDLAYLRPVGGTWAIVDADIFLNGETATWATTADGPGLQLQSVLAHEIGHVLGLLHPCGLPASGDVANGAPECGAGDTYATSLMHPSYSSPIPALAEDDELGVCAIFAPDDCAASGGTCTPPESLAVGFACTADAECSSGACVDGSCMALCDATTVCAEYESCVADASLVTRSVCLSRLSPFGGICARGNECISGLCLTTGADSYCTQPCGAVPCPSGFFCDEVAGMQVCRVNRPKTTGCSVVAWNDRGPGDNWVWAFLVLSALTFASRRRHRLPQSVIAAGALCALATASACGGGDTTPGEDAGHPIDGATDLGTMPTCSEPGATRVADCGNCGTRSEECAAGFWMARSMCLGEGACAATAVETETTPTCGQRQRLCTAACVWGAWDDIAPSTGECEVGTTRNGSSSCPVGMVRRQVCTAACAWVDGDCMWPCGTAPRSSANWDEEMVCVPGGPFMRGGSPTEPGEAEPIPDSLPLAEVRVSSFFIDRYPATNRRYGVCVDAGACTSTSGSSWRTRPESPFIEANYLNATTFCAFDGGRLPTEAEWEKAARGAAPSVRERPWQNRGTPWDCGALPISGIPCAVPTPANGLEGVGAFHGTASQFGAELMIGGVREWVSDWLDPLFYQDPASHDDPAGPTSGVFRVMRGEWHPLVTSGTRLSYRHATGTFSQAGIRCVRTST